MKKNKISVSQYIYLQQDKNLKFKKNEMYRI